VSNFKGRDIRNSKNGGLIRTNCSDLDAATQFAEAYGEQDGQWGWLWYWIHKAVQELPARDSDGLLDYICDWFLVAVGRGLKRPMIRVHFRDQRFKLYLSRRGTLCLKTGALEGDETDDGDDTEPTSYDPTGRERYIGCFLRGNFKVACERIAVPVNDGGGMSYYGRRRRYSSVRYEDGPAYKLNATEQEFLDRLKADPIGFLAECGRDMDRCCYCNLPLEDARSKDKGYGPVCASRWGLPWGKTKRGKEQTKSFAEVYNWECHLLCVSIRISLGIKDRTDKDDADAEVLWGMLSDWLKERCDLDLMSPRSRHEKEKRTKAYTPPLYPRWDGPAPRQSRCPYTTDGRHVYIGGAKECNVCAANKGLKGTIKVETSTVKEDPSCVSSTLFSWDKATQTLSADMTALDWDTFPASVTVKSVKTGATRTFAEMCRNFKGADLRCVRYKSKDGYKLVLHND